MAWLSQLGGGRLGQITGQLKDILTEGTEEESIGNYLFDSSIVLLLFFN
jgi:hypothetical protein